MPRRRDVPRAVPGPALGPEYALDYVLSPEIHFDGRELHLTYVAEHDRQHVRVTFEGLDAFHVARGEYPPYEEDQSVDPHDTVVALVVPSPWLRARHAYEARYYGDSYEWGRGADTMLVDTHHLLFTFHDEFVEVLARGLWFERSPDPWPVGAPRTPEHPANPLAPETCVASGESDDGLGWEVRANPRPAADVVRDARLHSHTLFELYLGDGTPHLSLETRAAHDGSSVRSELKRSFAGPVASWDRVPDIDEVMPRFETYVARAAESRREMFPDG